MLHAIRVVIYVLPTYWLTVLYTVTQRYVCSRIYYKQMSLDIGKTETVVDTVRGMTNREIAVMLTVAVSLTAGAFWVENRYAKLLETQAKLEQQQTEIIQLQNQLLQVVNSLPPEARKVFIEQTQVTQALGRNKTFIPQPKK